MLQNLFIGSGQKEKIAFNNAGLDISLDKFLADVNTLIAKLSATPCQRWALCYKDNYLFTVALFAVLLSKNSPILLPNNQSGTLEIFKEEFDAVLSDSRDVIENSRDAIDPRIRA